MNVLVEARAQTVITTISLLSEFGFTHDTESNTRPMPGGTVIIIGEMPQENIEDAVETIADVIQIYPDSQFGTFAPHDPTNDEDDPVV